MSLLTSKMGEFSKRIRDFTDKHHHHHHDNPSRHHRQRREEHGKHHEQRDLSPDLNLMDDDSSTYRSPTPQAQTSISTSPERVCVDNYDLRLGTLAAVSESDNCTEKKAHLSGRKATSEENSDDTRTSPPSRDGTGLLRQQLSLGSTKCKVGEEDVLFQKEETTSTTLPGEEGAPATVEVNPALERDGSASSIEFLMEETTSAARSKSPAPSSIKFLTEVNPSMVLPEVSSSSLRFLPVSSERVGVSDRLNKREHSGRSSPTPAKEAHVTQSKNASRPLSPLVGPWAARRTASRHSIQSSTRSTSTRAESEGGTLKSKSRLGSSRVQSSRGSYKSDFRSDSRNLLNSRGSLKSNHEMDLHNGRSARGSQKPGSVISLPKVVRPASSSPVRRRSIGLEERLQLLEDEISATREDIQHGDSLMEELMLRDPFNRLYHMNNRRDRDERRRLVHHCLTLQAEREQLLSETPERRIKRREQRALAEAERDAFFERLYQYSTQPRQSTPSRGYGGSSRTTPTRCRATSELLDATFQRLYEGALHARAARAERDRRQREEKERQEIDELLYTRVLARVELESPQRAHTPQSRAERARHLQENLLQDPKKLRRFLAGRQLTSKEEELLAWRLSRNGRVSAEKLEAQRANAELAHCTFHPRTNSRNPRRGTSMGAYRRDTSASAARRRRNTEDADTPPPQDSQQANRSSPGAQRKACEGLYQKALKQRQRRQTLAEEAERKKRLEFLKSKLKADHHFRRRVELDPSLAERYMASLTL